MRLTSLLILVLILHAAPALSVDVGFSLKGYMLLSGFVLFFHPLAGKFKINSFDWIFIVLVVYGGLTIFIAQDYVSTVRMFLGAIITFSSSMIIRGVIHNKERLYQVLPRVMVSYSWIIVCLSLLLYFFHLMNIPGPLYSVNNTSYIGLVIERNMPRLTGLSNDPNIFAFSMALPFWWLKSNRAKSRKIYILFLLVSFSIILTLSRSAFIIYGFLLIVNMLKTPSSLSKIIIRLMLLAVVCFVLFVIFEDLWEEYILPIVKSRYESAGRGSGRFELWQVGYEIFKTNPVFGIGWYNFLFYNVSYYGGTNYAHNTFIEVLVELGIFGFLLYLAFHAAIIVKFTQIRFKPKYLLYTYLTMIFFMNTLSLIINEMFFLTLALISLEGNE